MNTARSWPENDPAFPAIRNPFHYRSVPLGYALDALGMHLFPEVWDGSELDMLTWRGTDAISDDETAAFIEGRRAVDAARRAFDAVRASLADAAPSMRDHLRELVDLKRTQLAEAKKAFEPYELMEGKVRGAMRLARAQDVRDRLLRALRENELRAYTSRGSLIPNDQWRDAGPERFDLLNSLLKFELQPGDGAPKLILLERETVDQLALGLAPSVELSGLSRTEKAKHVLREIVQGPFIPKADQMERVRDAVSGITKREIEDARKEVLPEEWKARGRRKTSQED